MEARERLMEAALRVFQEAGSRGATTRKIAAEAGVNEITLFRHFGSKGALMAEAIACAAQRGFEYRLPGGAGGPGDGADGVGAGAPGPPAALQRDDPHLHGRDGARAGDQGVRGCRSPARVGGAEGVPWPVAGEGDGGPASRRERRHRRADGRAFSATP
jgi:hypothetical protein